jgi:glycosyltransferase involved in cell wall biosynthesis
MTSESRSSLRPAPKLALVIPCYNEEAVLGMTIARLAGQLSQLAADGAIATGSYLLLVDDGSVDATWEIIEREHACTPAVRGLRLSRNFGHQGALSAGLDWCHGRCDCAISIDADLQQDESAIARFIEEYRRGSEIVYGVRAGRQTDTLFKSLTARAFYKLMRAGGVRLIPNHADYRLMSAKALAVLREYTEGNLFLRGIIVQEMGLRSSRVTFDVRDRAAGTTKYSLRRMLSFALNGITSFSVAPLRMVFAVGMVFTVLSMLMAIYVMVQAVVLDQAVPGWASTVLPIYVLGGVQLTSIGIIGEYVGRVYREVKRRPRFIVETVLDD